MKKKNCATTEVNYSAEKSGSRLRRAGEIASDIFEAVAGLPVYIVLAVVALPAAAVGAIARLVSRRAAA